VSRVRLLLVELLVQQSLVQLRQRYRLCQP
jgi:hypothetical protein